MLRLLSSKAQGRNVFENHLNPAMLVFIGKLSVSTLRLVPICLGFSHFSGFCIILYLDKLDTSSIRVDKNIKSLIEIEINIKIK